MSSNFTGSVIIITGAASGMGREMTLQLARQHDCRILALDVREKDLQETKALAAEHAAKIESHLLDVGQAEMIERFAAEITPTLNSRKLILINNAGVALASGRFNDTPLEAFEWLLQINLYGVIRMTKAFLPYMLKLNQGHIITLSSVFGMAGVESNTAYCTSKFGNRGFTESLRMELLDTKIRTTCVHPGGIKTNISNYSLAAGNMVSSASHQEAKDRFSKAAKTTAASAAKQILRCVETGKQRLVIGSDGKFFDIITRLFPVSYTRVIVGLIHKSFGNPYAK
jgi:NAD(P)-dependent dehydrogenase (short-subunit alcohol dehydrogenase family)